jgi:hypothetical protein
LGRSSNNCCRCLDITKLDWEGNKNRRVASHRIKHRLNGICACRLLCKYFLGFKLCGRSSIATQPHMLLSSAMLHRLSHVVCVDARFLRLSQQHATVANTVSCGCQLLHCVLLLCKDKIFFRQLLLAICAETRPHSWLPLITRTQFAINIACVIGQLPHAVGESAFTFLLEAFHAPPLVTITAHTIAVA